MVNKELIEEMIELQRRVDRDRRQYELDAWMHLHLSIGQLKSLVFHQQPWLHHYSASWRQPWKSLLQM